MPIPLVGLVLFNRNRVIMGEFVKNRLNNVAAMLGNVNVLCLKGVLVF